MLAVMGSGWKDKKQGLIMTFEVSIQKKKTKHTLRPHRCKDECIQAGLPYSWLSSDVTLKHSRGLPG